MAKNRKTDISLEMSPGKRTEKKCKIILFSLLGAFSITHTHKSSRFLNS